jgi:hypothetical protein
MNDLPEYEYRISDAHSAVIQVRRTDEQAEHFWRLYMLCDSEEQANHVLNLLRYPVGAEAVQP